MRSHTVYGYRPAPVFDQVDWRRVLFTALMASVAGAILLIWTV